MFVTDAEVRQYVRLDAVMKAVKAAFIALGDGKSAIFPVARGTGTDPTHFFGVKSGRDGASGFLGVKAGSYNPANVARGGAAHTSTTMLFDDRTGALVGVVEANHLNGLRTAAANGVATDLLARRDAHILGVIGLGAQAEHEIDAVLAVRPITRILAATRTAGRSREFAERVAAKTGLSVELANAEHVVRRSDIVLTVTPATDPVLEAEWVQPGTHISAMGADNSGKQELPVDLFSRASLFVDHAPQAAVIGEAQHLVSLGLTTVERLAQRAIGTLLAENRAGRRSADEITVFDSSGLSIQDIAAAAAALDIVQRSRAFGGPLPLHPDGDWSHG